MENLNDKAKSTFGENNNEVVKMNMLEWKKWSDRFFPIEEKFDNWERELIWVLKH